LEDLKKDSDPDSISSSANDFNGWFPPKSTQIRVLAPAFDLQAMESLGEQAPEGWLGLTRSQSGPYIYPNQPGSLGSAIRKFMTSPDPPKSRSDRKSPVSHKLPYRHRTQQDVTALQSLEAGDDFHKVVIKPGERGRDGIALDMFYDDDKTTQLNVLAV
jgi:hypothetical protein